jgi:hypothetical protein
VQTFVPTTIISTGITYVPVSTGHSDASKASSSKTAAVAGGVVGAIILLIGVLLLGLFIRKRRRSQALYLSSRPDDAERSMSSNADAPVFSMINPQPSVAPSLPSIVVAPPQMTQTSSRPVHKKAVPSVSQQEINAAAVTTNKPTSYVLDVDPPTSSVASMAFNPATFAESLGKDPAWAAVLGPTASANPFEDPVNPFADPQPKTRLSEMPEIPKHLRMSTTSSSLSSRNSRTADDAPSSPTSTIYHDGFAM